MIEITGYIPKIIYDRIPRFSNLYPKGNDIDIVITENGVNTTLSAITLGNGTWDIDELDDNLNLFPEYSEGDMISSDVIEKIILELSNVDSSTNILSFNALGKIKYGIKDFKRKVKDKVDYLTDDLDADTALRFISKYYPGAKIMEFDYYMKKDGKIYKTLFSSQGKFYIMSVLRNGNDFRFLDDDDYDVTPIYSTPDKEQAIEIYNNYPTDVTEEDNNVIETEESEESDDNNVIENEKPDYEFKKKELLKAFIEDLEEGTGQVIDFETITDNKYKYNNLPTAIAIMGLTESSGSYVGWQKFYDDGDGNIISYDGHFIPIKDENSADEPVRKIVDEYYQNGGKKTFGSKLKLVQSMKKKKKSKYNGLDVTGYESGSLSPMADNVLPGNM